MNRYLNLSLPLLEIKLLKNFVSRIRGYKDHISSPRKDDPQFQATHGTMDNVRDLLFKRFGATKAYSVKFTEESNPHMVKYFVTKQSELPKRTMNDSFASAIIPLSSDESLREKYVTLIGTVRIGRLLEDMDLFALHVSHLHIYNPRVPEGEITPYMVLTARVDKIVLTDFIPKSNKDIRLSGHISWVGRSIMEATVWLEQYSGSKFHKITKALFLMAARKMIDKKAAIVNGLEFKDEREKKIFELGQQRREKQWLVSSQELTKVVPTEFEQKLMHDLFIKTIGTQENTLAHRSLPPESEWMKKFRLSNIILSYPENRNMHNMVVGGFIMKQALELSWPLAYLFCKHQPILRVISDIAFYKPLAVNNLINMKACVVYSKMQYFQITVYVDVWDAVAVTKSTTHVFHFTFESPLLVGQVYPYTYQESMMYIDGYRHFSQSLVKDHKIISM